MKPSITASAPGKIILSGEHAVVYGYPALVTSVGLRAKCKIIQAGKSLIYRPVGAKDILRRSLRNTEKYINTKYKGLDLKLVSDVPIGCCVGSSAAVGVAATAALVYKKFGILDKKLISEIAYETEKYYHGNPSGVDITIAVNGGTLWYRKESEKFKLFSKIIPKNKLNDLVLINTGKPQESTAEMVGGVSELYRKNPGKVGRIFKNIEKMTRSFLRFILDEENLSLIELIKENEKYLEELDLVSSSTSDLIKQIEKIGGAAKISGGGGRKGNSGMILVYHPDIVRFRRFAQELRLNIIKTKFGVKGVRVEKN